MNNRDRLRLRHILEWTDEILRMADKRKRDDLESGRMFCHAVRRCLEVIGEAASKISPDCRMQYSLIPWESIIGMRNRLIHAYFDIQLDIIWKTIIHELPDLRKKVAAILSGE